MLTVYRQLAIKDKVIDFNNAEDIDNYMKRVGKQKVKKPMTKSRSVYV